MITNAPNMLEQKLSCIVTGLGEQVGEMMRCLIQSEIDSHLARIRELELLMRGLGCEPQQSTGEVPVEVNTAT